MLVNFCFSFVWNSSAYITIPQNNRKIKINWDKKLTTTYTWTEPLQDINQQNIIFEKTDILLTNDSLVPKQQPELQPSSPASRSLPGEEQKQREKLH